MRVVLPAVDPGAVATALVEAGGVPLGGLQLVPQPFGLGLGLPQQLPRLGEALLGVLRA